MADRCLRTYSILVLILGLASMAGAEPAELPEDPAPVPGVESPAPIEASTGTDRVLEGWQASPPTAHARTAALRRIRLELGLGDLAGPAIAILRGASEDEPEIHAQLARDLAPELPEIQMANGAAFWKAGDPGAALNSWLAAARAMTMDLEIRLWLIESLSLWVVLIVLGASLAFVALAAFMVFPHAAHDLGDLFSTRMPPFARFGALAALILLPLILGEGILGLALALFAVAFAYGKGRQRSVLIMAAMLLVIGLHPLARLASVTTTLLEEDPIAGSVLAVASGVESQADLERLERARADDLSAAHALAYHARRLGREDEARQRLDEIAQGFPTDPVMLTNRGNIEMRAGRIEEAIAYYEQADAVVESPILLFDLSQAYAAAFRMEEYEVTLAQAQELNDAQVAELSSLEDAQLVADLGMPFDSLQNRLISLALARAPQQTVAQALAPGRLGERWLGTAGAFGLVVLVCLLFADRFDHASRCTRCGHRICGRCEETVWSEEICEDCHHLFQNPQATDPSLRMARLQALSRRDALLDRAWLFGSLLIPGVAGFASRRPDLAISGLLLFGWTATWLAWPRGVFADPMGMGSAAWLCLAIPGVLSLLGYVGVVLQSLAIRKNL